MPGTPHYLQFNDFVEATGPKYVTGPEYFVNEAQKQTYSFGWLTGGRTGRKRMIQGGSEIREKIVFETGNTFGFHNPGEEREWINPQKLVHTRVYWRFSEAHMSWTRQELELNEKVKYGTPENRFQAYVDLRNEKEGVMVTDKWNGMEAQMWKEPNAAMEGEGGKEAYSMPFFVNQHVNGLFDPGDGSGTPTTLAGIDPTDTALGRNNWAIKTRTYGTAIGAEADLFAQDNIIAVFDRMWLDVRYEMPPTMQEYFENPRMNRQVIASGTAGRVALQQAMRVYNDHFRMGGQEPAYPNPVFNGIPVRWVSELDTSTLYTNAGGTGVTNEGSAASFGPRYYWLNSEFLYPVFHDIFYFEKDEVSRHHNDPDTFVCPINTWYNLCPTSLRHQGMVFPSTDVYTNLYT